MKTFTVLKGFLSFALISFALINRTSAQVTTNANPANVNRSVSNTSVISATIAGDVFTSATWADPGSGVTVSATTLSGGNTVASATATFSANGSFTFTLTYTKASTGATSFTATVTVQAVQLTLTPSATQNDVQGDFEDFSSNPTGYPGSGAYTYLWNVSPSTGVTYINATTNTSAAPRIQFASPGSFAVTVTQSRGGVTVTSTSTTVNIVAPSVTNSPSATQNIDAGDFVNFSSNPSNFTTNGGGAYTYNWQVTPSTGVSFINATTNTSSNPRIQFASAGSFSVVVTQSRNGYSATSAATTVNVAAATIAISPNTTQNVLAGGSLNFTGTPGTFGGSGNYSYTWTAAGATISGSNPESDGASNPKTITFPTAGVYSVSVSATRNGASATSSATTVNAWSVNAGPDQVQPNTSASLNGSASGPGAITYLWTRQSGPNTPTLTNSTSANASLSGLIAGTYVYRLTINGVASLFDEVTIHVNIGANLWATSSSGTRVSSFSVSNGTYNSGPTDIFTPDGGSTAALGRSANPNLVSGYFYWLPNNGGNGVVNVYGASAAGNNQTLIGTLDVNGASNNDMGFVRLAMGPDGKGWLLARESSTNQIYLASFVPNGVDPITITVVDADVTINGGLNTTFQNGDICLSGSGTIFALANNGSGVTQIFIGLPNGSSTQLTKKWDLRDNTNAPFTGTVNGVAFDAVGSLYISCADGLFYINQATVNGADGTVLCTLVHEVSGLQDLASNVFPNQTQLPVDLISFTGMLKNNITTLRWETENEQNFDHFEIERRTDNAGAYAKIGEKASLGSIGRSSYQFDDVLSAVMGSAFNYRLKIVDQDGKFKYSNIILVRRDQNILAGIKMSPNPVVGGIATARFSASADAVVSFRVVDMSGKTVLTQQAKVFEGENSVSINNLDRLQPGMYLLNMENNGTISSIKFSVSR